MTETYKIAIVGASSIRGKELNEVLADSALTASDFLLMDDDSQLGQLESVGDEVTFIQRIEPDSFRKVDFVFFAGAPEVTQRHWRAAQKAGASIIDLTGALEGEPGVLVLAPMLEEDGKAGTLNLSTPAVVVAHPVAVALALLVERFQELGTVKSASATVLEPASEYGNAALDELHQQTIGLLNFQNPPKTIFDTQIAFNVAPVFGGEAKASLATTETRIRRHYDLLTHQHKTLPQAAIQLLQAPVFHGHGISLAIELEQKLKLEHVEAALDGEHVDVVLGDGDADVPNNLNTVGQSDVMVRVRTADGIAQEASRFWIWAALDNLKFSALNAVACALELRKLRPQGKVQ